MQDIGRLIERAGLGLSSWDDVNAEIISAFPGSFSFVMNQSRQTGQPTFASIAGMTDKARENYIAYYSLCNPWSDCWSKTTAGQILLSEETYPIGMYAGTEFVNDWLKPIQNHSVAVGVKLNATRDDDILFGIHYDLPYRDRYERKIVDLIEACSGPLVRAVEMNGFLNGRKTADVAAASLIERGGAMGCVVDDAMKLIEANAACATAFSSGDVVTGMGGILRFADPVLQRSVAQAVRALLTDRPVAATTFILRRMPHLWQVKIARVPQYDPRSAHRMFMPRHLAMILISDLARPHDQAIDHTPLAAMGLTRSEIRLCEALSKGLTLAEAAEVLRITQGTARQHLKAIFSKSGLRRQAELALLLSRLR